LVKFVDNFNDTKNLVYLLKLGYIVVSKKPTEIGVEYYVPFSNGDKLIVAAVQCKFVQGTVNWQEIKRVMNIAIGKVERQISPTSKSKFWL